MNGYYCPPCRWQKVGHYLLVSETVKTSRDNVAGAQRHFPASSVQSGRLNGEVKVASPGAARGSQCSSQRLRNTGDFAFLSSISCIQLKSWITVIFKFVKCFPTQACSPLSSRFAFYTSLLFVPCNFLLADKCCRCQKFKKNVGETNLKWTKFSLLTPLLLPLNWLEITKASLHFPWWSPQAPQELPESVSLNACVFPDPLWHHSTWRWGGQQSYRCWVPHISPTLPGLSGLHSPLLEAEPWFSILPMN